MELEIKNVSHTYKNGKKALSEISTSLTRVKCRSMEM